jgi:diguanylate cyclase (GGDEF)-like protein
MIGFSLLLLLMLLIIATGLGYSAANNSRMEQIVNVHTIRANQLNQLRNYSRELSVLYYQMVFARDPFSIDELNQKASTLSGEFLKVKEQLLLSSTRQEDIDKLNNLMTLAGRTYKLQHEVFDLLSIGEYDKAAQLMVKKVQSSQNESVDYYDLLVDEQQQFVSGAAHSAQQAYQNSFLLMLGISSLAIFLGAIISFFVVKKALKSEQILKRGNVELEKLVHDRTHELHQLANTDTLTGIFNRRRFNDVLQMELARAKRYGSFFSLIIFDVDHFKRINDTFGHQPGDDVLKELALLISGALRDTDILARWGGEEFIILSPFGDLKQPDVLAERLRAQIEAHTFTGVGKITCSFGVTSYGENDTEETMMKRADDNLYRAKNEGRNRVCLD